MSALHLRYYGTLPVGTEPQCDKCGAPLHVPSAFGSIRWVNNEQAWRNDPSNCREDVAREDTWLIRKNGYFYRPNSRGYTASIYEAGLYSREDAEQEARIEPGITAHPISEYRQLAEVDLAQAKRVIALIDGCAPKPAPVIAEQRKP